MLRLRTKPHDGGAKDGRFEMSLAMPGIVVGVERLVGSCTRRSNHCTCSKVAGPSISSPSSHELASCNRYSDDCGGVSLVHDARQWPTNMLIEVL